MRDGYKKTEIGVIPLDWEVVKLKKLIENKAITSHLDGNHGGLYPKQSEFVKSGVPYLSANMIKENHIDFNLAKFLTKNRANKFKKGVARNNDILFAHNATVGPVTLLKTELSYVILSTTLTYYRCDLKKLNNYYLMNYMKSIFFINQYKKFMKQSTRNQIPITQQRELFFIIPPLTQQKKIAKILSTTDNKIEAITKQIEKAEMVKKGLMQRLLRNESWKTMKLKDTFLVIIDGDRGNNYPKKEDFKDEGFCLFLSAKNITKNGFKLNEKQFISEEKDNLLRKGKLKKLDIIITTRGSVGHIAYNKNIMYANMRINSGMVILRNSDENINQEYLYKLFSSNIIQRQIEKITFGSAQPQLTVKEINNLKIPIPSIKEQKKIAKILSTSDQKIEILKAKKEQYQILKTGLMQKLLTGEIGV